MPYTGLTRVPMHQRERISNPNVDRVDLRSTNQNRQKWENLQHAKLSFSGPGFAFGVGDAWRLPWDWAVRRRSLTRATKKRKARKRTPKKPIYQRVRASLCVKPRHSEISLVQERSISELFTKFRLSSASNYEQNRWFPDMFGVSSFLSARKRDVIVLHRRHESGKARTVAIG